MELTVTIEDKATPELPRKIQKAAEKFIREAALHIEGELKASMTEPKSGRIYDRDKVQHQASAPGESPAVDSSNLINSIVTSFPETLEARIATAVEYASYLEYGAQARTTRKTKSGNALMGPHMGGLLPRPLWQRTLDEQMPTLEKMLDAAIAEIK